MKLQGGPETVPRIAGAYAALQTLLLRSRSAAMRRHAVLAGVFDAGLSSLASFAVGLYAARTLDAVQLGGYALAAAAWGLAITVPASLAFTPLEIIAVACHAPGRLRFLRRSLMLGIWPTVLPAIAVPLWMPFAPPTIRPDVVVGLTVTSTVAALASPPQDHLRRMLHIAGLSWYATLVSVVQLIVAVGSLVVFRLENVPPSWAPFGALALANIASLSVGMLLARRREGRVVPIPPARFAAIMRSGSWLLMTSLVPTAGAFIVAAIAAHLAGAAVLGYAEVARLSGQPLLVLSTGLSATLGPGLVAAAQQRKPDEARRVGRLCVMITLVVGAAYLALVGADWRGNPLASILPKAYVVPGLVAATILANATHGISNPLRSEVLGAGKEVALTKIEVVANALRVLITGATGALGAFIIPCGVLVIGLARWLGCHMVLRSYYGRKVP
jgi:O-antigen/teichoic acid export membrane protein